VYKVRTYNNIAKIGLDQFTDQYEVGPESDNPDAILLRSHKLQIEEINSNVKAIGRAGAGVNNVPVDYCSSNSIVVFNAPGANANAVKELVMAGILLGSRGIISGIHYVNGLSDMKDADAMNKLLEKEKKNFKGRELQGKTLGVIGLGAIGSQVANMALTMGMKVIGYDPAISIEAAWRLSSDVKKMDSLESLFSNSDYVSLHLPVLESTRKLINSDLLKSAKTGCKLLNFARSEIVDADAIVESLDRGQLSSYIADFPKPNMIGRDDVILMPHIGASTDEAEENCAVMVANQLSDYLENGNIINSVNFPTAVLDRTSGHRLSITNKNIPNMLGGITSILAEHNINVIDLLNKSRGDLAYNLIDIETPITKELENKLLDIEGVIDLRVL
jgi:D-3-phosphoglycerate dehydrogenase